MNGRAWVRAAIKMAWWLVVAAAKDPRSFDWGHWTHFGNWRYWVLGLGGCTLLDVGRVLARHDKAEDGITSDRVPQ